MADVPNKRTLDSRTYLVSGDTYRIETQRGLNYSDVNDVIQQCEIDIVESSSENGFDYSVEKIRFPVHIDANGKRRHKPDKHSNNKRFDIDRPVLPGLGSPVVTDNKITWSRPGWYDYSVIVFPEGSKIEVTFWQEPPEKTLTFNTARAGLNRAETDAFMERPPTAKDANDNDVPLTWVKENRKVTVSMNDMGATYPIVVDPTLVLDEGTGCEDTRLRAQAPTTNYGSAGDGEILNTPTHSSCNVFLVRFDFSALPAGATITDSTFEFRCYTDPGSGGTDVYCRHLNDDSWTEMGATWETHDGSNAWASGDFSASDWTTTDQDSDTSTGSAKWFTYSLVSMTQHAQSDHSEILDMVCVQDADYEDRLLIVHSEDTFDITERPKLTIVYTEGAEELLAGTSDGVSTTGASVDVIKELIVSSDGLSTTAVPAMEATRKLAGASSGVSSANTVGMIATRELAGTTAGISTADAVIEEATELSGASVGTSTTASTLKLVRGLVGASGGTSTVGSTAYITKKLSGATNGISTAGVTLAEATLLSGASNGLSTTVVAAMESIRKLACTSDGIATAGAVLDITSGGEINMAMSSDGLSTVGAITKITKEVVGTSDGIAAVAAGTKVTRLFVGASDGVSSVVVTVKINKTFAGASAGVAVVSATVKPIRELVGLSEGQSVVTDVLMTANVPIRASPIGTSTAGITLDVTTKFATLSDGLAVVGANLVANFVLSGTTDGLATVQAILNKIRPLAGVAGGTSTATVAMEIDEDINVIGSSAGVATVTCSMIQIPTHQRGSVDMDTGVKGRSGIRTIKRLL